MGQMSHAAVPTRTTRRQCRSTTGLFIKHGCTHATARPHLRFSSGIVASLVAMATCAQRLSVMGGAWSIKEGEEFELL